jgi:5-methyltetrahydrofolate corrinoid/iron sulfur protein methyltransferase
VGACWDAGAKAIDINSGPLSRMPEEKIAFLVRTVQESVDLPIILDSANTRAMAAGLAACHQSAVINGVSLEPDRHVTGNSPLIKS